MIRRYWLTILLWSSAAGSRFPGRVAVAIGVGLALTGLGAVVYGTRVAVAHADYYRLKYGSLVEASPEEKAPLAEQAHARYPSNYYLSELMADDFWVQSSEGGWARIDTRRTAAIDWCERGRQQNPYRRELVWTAADIARHQSPAAALAIWEPYVERVFWDPWNLAALISLQAEAGQVAAARKLLPLLHGRAEYAAAARAIE